MREALMLQLEKLSYYQHLSLSGGQERPIYSCRVVDIRGSQYHVLSRIQDAGLDFTGRTNFLAHHLVFTPEEIRKLPSPPIIMRSWSGWMKSWSAEPQLLEAEGWSSLSGLAANVSVPANTWKEVTGDGINGYGLLEVRAGVAFRVDGLTEEAILNLFAESLELLELRDPRRDFRATAWQHTFTTSMQEQDNPGDFRWRCLHSDNPASNRFASPDCRALADVRAARVTAEETTLARSGRQPPRFVVQPQDARSTEGEPVRLQARAEGVPQPMYEWFSVDRANKPHAIANENGVELVVRNPPLGLSRYIVRASNSRGEATSDVATLSVERKLRLSQPRTVSEVRSPLGVAGGHIRTAEEIDADRERHRARKVQAMTEKKPKRNKIVAAFCVMLALVAVGSVLWVKSRHQKSSTLLPASTSSVSAATAQLPAPTNVTEEPQKPGTSEGPLKLDRPEPIGNPQPDGERPAITPAPTQFSLPAGWSRVAIGTVSNPDNAFIQPRYDLSAAAHGFSTNGDAVWYVFKTNFAKSFEATLISQERHCEASGCGLMVRESEKTNAPFMFIGASSTKIVVFHRDAAGKFNSSTNDIPKLWQNKPIYFRIQQSDNMQLFPCYSFDSKPKVWITGSQSNAIPRSGATMIGFSVYSGSTSNKVFAKFGGVLEQ